MLALLGSLAAVGVGVGMAYGVATIVELESTFAPSTGAEATVDPGKESTWIGGLLITDNRDELSICVNAVGLSDKAGVEASVVASVDAALTEMKKSPRWESEIEKTPVAANTKVVAGCPEGTLISAPTPGEWGERVANYTGRVVNHASPHVLYVHVLPEAEILRIVGPHGNHHVAIEELLCSGDQCLVATQALYYSPSDLADVELVTREMEFALSLRSDPW